MTEFYIPTGSGEAELVEKRSRFIGRVRRVETEEQARAFIEAVRKKEYDANHNCWCYALHDGTVRCSDDGEPQGTAGQPMLGVFQREGIENVCCVVTRYFGGVLLGAGGLVRAYTQSAKDALDAAGVSVVRRWMALDVPCPYARLETLRRELAAFGGAEEGADYAQDVLLHALLPEERAADFAARVTDLTAGAVTAQTLGERLRDVPLRPPKRST